MTTETQQPDPAAQGTNEFHEADIGSGEPSPGQQETDAMIREIPVQGDKPPGATKDGAPSAPPAPQA